MDVSFVTQTMIESFAQLFEESLNAVETRQGSIVKGTVVAIENGFVLVDAGLKSESAIPAEEFKNALGELEINVGDTVDVALDSIEDGFGETKLSREKAKRHEAWLQLEKAYEEQATVIGIINGKVKGGFTVELNGIRAFLPGSLVDVRPIRDTAHLENKELEFKVIKLDQKRNNVVVSRRAVIETENTSERESLLANLQEGQEVKGIVKNLTDYGCFVEIEEGVEGLVHVSEMDWTNKNIHPSKVVNVGDVVDVMVLDIDEERRRISLGLKQCKSNPWQLFAETHAKGDRVSGKIKSITDFGIFIGLDGGIDGLVHLSDISWNNQGEEAVREFKKGDEIEAVVLQVDPERERISLGVKQIEEDPFNKYLSDNKKGAIVKGKVTEVDAKGAVIELADGVEGYLRSSDAARDRVEDATLVLSVGDEVEAKFMGVDRKNRTVSLSVRAKDEADERVAIDSLNQQEEVVFSNAMMEAFKAAKGE